jgi:hypothetical protein
MADIRQLTKEQVEALPKGAEIYVKRTTSSAYRKAFVLRKPEYIDQYLVVDFSFAKPGYENTMSMHDHLAVYGQEKIAQKGDPK